MININHNLCKYPPLKCHKRPHVKAVYTISYTNEQTYIKHIYI